MTLLLDVNLLVFAKSAALPQHGAARQWFDETLTGAHRVGLPWETLCGFLRLVTNGRIFPRPMTAEAAWAQVEEWLALPQVWVPGPVPTHAQILGRLVRDHDATSKRVPDAHLAAIAIGHGLCLCSADDDFRQFSGLRFLNPLVAPPHRR